MQRIILMLAWGGVAVLLTTALLMLVPVAMDGIQIERAYQAQVQTFRTQYQHWQAQQIEQYTVNYTSCFGTVCCTGIMTVTVDEFNPSLEPACPRQPYLQSYQGKIRSMDQFYTWLGTFYDAGRWVSLDVSYHPEQHYITRLRLLAYEGTPVLEIRYEDLTPLPDNE